MSLVVMLRLRPWLHLLIGASLLVAAVAASAGEMMPGTRARLSAAESALVAGVPAVACTLADSAQWPAALTDRAQLVRANCEAAAGNYSRAARLFAELASRHPDEPRLRLDQALAHALAGERAAAQAALDSLLGESLSETMLTRVARLRSQLAAGRRWRFGAELSAGWVYDSNVTAGPDSPIVRAYGLPFRLDPSAMERSDQGNTLGANAVAQYRLSDRSVLGLQADVASLDYRSLNAFDSTTFALSPYFGLQTEASRWIVSAYGTYSGLTTNATLSALERASPARAP